MTSLLEEFRALQASHTKGLTRCCSAVCPTTKNRRARCRADTRSDGRRGGLAGGSAVAPPPAHHVRHVMLCAPRALLVRWTCGLRWQKAGARINPTIGVILQSAQFFIKCKERAVCSKDGGNHHQWRARRVGARLQHTGCRARGAARRWPPPRPRRLSTRRRAAGARSQSIASNAGAALCDLQLCIWSDARWLLQVYTTWRHSVRVDRAATCSRGATSTPTRQRVMRSVCFGSLTY